MNLTLQELGWITREPIKGWTATPQGLRAGAIVKEARQSGIPYVVWDPKVQHHKALISAVNEVNEDWIDALTGRDAPQSAQQTTAVTLQSAPTVPVSTVSVEAPSTANPRDAFPAAYRTQDGHRVRSRAEAMIDDWLYRNGVLHAYERKVPIEQDMICDFWLPRGRVYIEYWGMDRNARYLERKKEKQALYERNELKLIELGDEELQNLDDHLARLLRKHGIPID